MLATANKYATNGNGVTDAALAWQRAPLRRASGGTMNEFENRQDRIRHPYSQLFILGSLLATIGSGCLGTTRNAQLRTYEPVDPLGKGALGSFYNVTNLSPAASRDR